MIRFINKQQLVRERLARELLVLHLEGRDHLRPVQQYAESYGVGRGTVQSAFQELKDCGAIVLNACGARGTFLERVEQRKLFDACGYGELICLMPLNINRDYRGLATGIYETISAKDLPIHILFARGSRNRIKMLLRQKCDFVAMSQLACEAAIERRGHTIEAVQALGSYPAELGVITRRGRDYVPGQTKVAFDRYSYDQCALHALLGMRPDERKDCLNVQLADMVRLGMVEAALYDRCAVPEDGELQFHPLEMPEETRAKLHRAVVVIRHGDEPMRDLLKSTLKMEVVTRVQEEVLAGTRLVKY